MSQEIANIFASNSSSPVDALLRSPIVIIVFIGLYGLNIKVLTALHINFLSVLAPSAPQTPLPTAPKTPHKQPSSQPPLSTSLLTLSLSLLLLLSLIQTLYIRLANGSSLGACVLFYSVIALALLAPLPQTKFLRTATAYLASTLLSILLHPLTATPPFLHVFVTDALCSLSKTFFDTGYLLVLLSCYPSPAGHSLSTVLTPCLFSILPYLLRAKQCLQTAYVEGDKPTHKAALQLVNCGKYLCSMVPVVASAVSHYHGGQSGGSMESVIVGSLILATSYSCAWDVFMDWGFCGSKFDRIRINRVGASRFGVAGCWIAVVVNTALRFSWMLRFYQHLFKETDHYVLLVEFLEVLRRAVWNVFRVEWQVIVEGGGDKDVDEQYSEEGVELMAGTVELSEPSSRRRSSVED